MKYVEIEGSSSYDIRCVPSAFEGKFQDFHLHYDSLKGKIEIRDGFGGYVEPFHGNLNPLKLGATKGKDATLHLEAVTINHEVTQLKWTSDGEIIQNSVHTLDSIVKLADAPYEGGRLFQTSFKKRVLNSDYRTYSAVEGAFGEYIFQVHVPTGLAVWLDSPQGRFIMFSRISEETIITSGSTQI